MHRRPWRSADLVLSLHDTVMYARARDALRRASSVQRSPDVLLAWGRMERAADEPDSALAAFEAALRSGGPRSLSSSSKWPARDSPWDATMAKVHTSREPPPMIRSRSQLTTPT